MNCRNNFNAFSSSFNRAAFSIFRPLLQTVAQLHRFRDDCIVFGVCIVVPLHSSIDMTFGHCNSISTFCYELRAISGNSTAIVAHMLGVRFARFQPSTTNTCTCSPDGLQHAFSSFHSLITVFVVPREESISIEWSAGQYCEGHVYSRTLDSSIKTLYRLKEKYGWIFSHVLYNRRNSSPF